MLKILKRNQLIILVISLILITAGYLNYTSEVENNTVMTSEIIAELGDATLVSSNQVESVQEDIETSNNESNEVASSIEEKEEVETSVKEDDTYYSSSKLDRDSMYSELLETYQEIYNNQSSTAEQKNKAIEEIAKINKMKNSIMIAENLIKIKGFKDVVIFANTNSISVIVKEAELAQEQIAQIQNIVSRELEVEAEIIHISTK